MALELAPHPQSYKLVKGPGQGQRQGRLVSVISLHSSWNSSCCFYYSSCNSNSFSYYSNSYNKKKKVRFVEWDIMAHHNQLRHVESMGTLPSGAGKIPHLNAVILGEAIASEENDFIYPSDDFSRQAHISSPHQVRVFVSSISLDSRFSTLGRSIPFPYV